MGYADTTGNVLVTIGDPGLSITAEGAGRDPVAIDCVTGFGRMPAEGEALLAWMRQRAPRRQPPSLTETAELP